MPQSIRFASREDANLLYPFTATQAVEQLLTGAFTNAERWENAGFDTQKHETAYPVNPHWMPGPHGLTDILSAPEKSCFFDETGQWIAGGESSAERHILSAQKFIFKPAQWLNALGGNIAADIESAGPEEMDTDSLTGVFRVGTHPVYADSGVRIEPMVVLDTTNGPIWLRKNSLVMAGSCLRGPLVLGENTVVKMGALLYGPIATGPNCTLGGEIKNVVVMEGSNKAHHGYLGDSIVGRWCNLGAGTTNSNVKNTAGTVSWWNEAGQAFESVGVKAGMLMGDFCRTAINTSINTGSVFGPVCNLFGDRMPPRFLPAFRWGSDGGELYNLSNALRHTNNWMAFKNRTLSVEEQETLTQIYQSLTKN